jgi:hypothetical protein
VSSARKPVIVRKLARDWCAGYAAANPTGEAAELELLDSSGKLLRIAWESVKWVCYVRELNSGDGSASDSRADNMYPERLLRRRFTGRPRVSGVWLRLTLTDGDELEGVAANDRSLVDGVGLLLIPPDTRSNTQRVFIPRTSIRDLKVLGVIGPGVSGNSAVTAGHSKASLQPELFEPIQGNEQDS